MCAFIGYNSLFSVDPVKRISCKLLKNAYDIKLGLLAIGDCMERNGVHACINRYTMCVCVKRVSCTV